MFHLTKAPDSENSQNNFKQKNSYEKQVCNILPKLHQLDVTLHHKQNKLSVLLILISYLNSKGHVTLFKKNVFLNGNLRLP